MNDLSTMVVDLVNNPLYDEFVFIARLVEDGDQHKLYHSYGDNRLSGSDPFSEIDAIRKGEEKTEVLLKNGEKVREAEIDLQVLWRSEEELYIYVTEVSDRVACLNVRGSINARYNFNPRDGGPEILFKTLRTAVEVEKRNDRWFFEVTQEGDCSFIDERDLHDHLSNNFSEKSEMVVIGDKTIDLLKPNFSKGISVLEFN